MSEVKLTRLERLILCNQYAILEKVAPGEGSWEKAREVFENGYELDYSSYMTHIDEDAVSRDECQEVLDILNLAEVIQGTDLSSLSKGQRVRLRFDGFYGNEESKHLAYARFLQEQEKLFRSVETSDRMDSHCPTLQWRRPQINAWRRMGQPRELSLEQLREIAGPDE